LEVTRIYSRLQDTAGGKSKKVQVRIQDQSGGNVESISQDLQVRKNKFEPENELAISSI
jgi:hypothetical protein